MKLKLNSEQIQAINSLARQRKFTQDKRVIYNENNISLITNFIKSYEFLNNLSENILEDTEEQKSSKKEIEKYLQSYKILFLESHKLLNLLNLEINFGKSNFQNKLRNLIEENKEQIISFINTIFPIGRVISVYDPDEAVGIK